MRSSDGCLASTLRPAKVAATGLRSSWPTIAVNSSRRRAVSRLDASVACSLSNSVSLLSSLATSRANSVRTSGPSTLGFGSMAHSVPQKLPSPQTIETQI